MCGYVIAAGGMSFPVLQVAALAGEQPMDEVAVSGGALPPVASNTPVHSAVYSIGESSRRPRSAGAPIFYIKLW